MTTGSVGLARNHDFRRLDDGEGRLAAFELQLFDGVACNDGRQSLIANPQPDLGEQFFDAGRGRNVSFSGIDASSRLEDVVTTDPVVTAFHGKLRYEMNIPADDHSELFFHRSVIEETPSGCRFERR
jgi:hypothetical protein